MRSTVKPSVPVLKKRLTIVFNMYIRLRDKDLPCISCGQPLPFAGSHAGHFVSSTYTVHRFNELNVNKQCPSCNLFRHGNLISYFIGLERKYSPIVPRELEATKHTIKKYTAGELLELIEQYKVKVKEMQ
jgi:hypothetical protein